MDYSRDNFNPCGTMASETTFPATEVMDKTLIANVSVNVRDFPGTRGKIIRTVKPGQTVGVVYSYDDKNSPGEIWWQLYTPDGKNNLFVQHAPGRFNLSALRDQGAKTDAEKEEAKAEADKPWYEKLGAGINDDIKLLLKWGIGLSAAGLLLRTIILASQSKKKKKITT